MANCDFLNHILMRFYSFLYFYLSFVIFLPKICQPALNHYRAFVEKLCKSLSVLFVFPFNGETGLVYCVASVTANRMK